MLALALSIACATLAAPSTAHALEGNFVAGNATIDGLYGQMTIHPQAVWDRGKLFFAYQGTDLDPYVVSYDSSSGVWAGPVRAGDNPLKYARDRHGAPAVWVDRSGYVHVVYGAHNTLLRHSVSLRPRSISGFRAFGMPKSPYTYPQVLHAADGRIFLFTRGSPASWADWVYRTSWDGGYTWSPPKVVLHGDGSHNWYANFQRASDGSVLATFTRNDFTLHQETKDLERYDLFYMRMGSTGVWHEASGSAAVIPATWGSALARSLICASGTNSLNQQVGGDVEGKPFAIYLTGGTAAEDTTHTWRCSYYAGGVWSSTDIATTRMASRTGTLEYGPGDRVTAYLSVDPLDDDVERVAIVPFVSDDGGKSWTRGDPVSPATTGKGFDHPELVEGAPAESRLLFTDFRRDSPPAVYQMYLWGSAGLAHRSFTPSLSRISSGDRYGLSARLSRIAHPAGSNVVYLASGTRPFDALAAGPTAASRSAPVLLTTRDSLPLAAVREIDSLQPSKIVIVGGVTSISNGVVNQIHKRWRHIMISRVSGRDRYEVAARMARIAAPKGSRQAVIVSGGAVADALSSGPLASALHAPLLLVSARSTPKATADALRSLGVTSTVLVGGTMSVSSHVAGSLPHPVRIAGGDRYTVAANVAGYGLTHGMSAARAAIASGLAYPDALSGSMLAWRYRGPLLLADHGHTGAASAYLASERSALMDSWLVGGVSTLDRSVESALRAALR